MKTLITLGFLTAALLLGQTAGAALPVTDNFSYGESSGSVVGLTTASTSGWGAAGWAGATSIIYEPALSINMDVFSGETQVGGISGYVQDLSGGRLLSPQNPSGAMVTRPLAEAVGGTMFVSFAAQGTFWNAAVGALRTMVAVNGSNTNMFGFISRAGTQTVRVDVIADGATQSTHIGQDGIGNSPVLGIAMLETNYAGSNDRITFWGYVPRDNPDLSGQNLAALGTPLLVAEGANLWGDSISSLGVFLSSPDNVARNGYVDSLRLSFGNDLSNDEHVARVLTGIPEPTTYALLFGVGVAGLVFFRRQRKPAR